MKDPKETKITETVETLQADIIDLTLKLVKQSSTLGEEGPILRTMAEELKKLKLEPIRVEMLPEELSKHPGWNPLPDWAPTPINYANHYNLVAVRPADGRGGHSALFNGHLDIVSSEPLASWTQDPFQPILKDGWIYGRGAGDMKSGVALMCYAQKAIEKAGFGLRAPVTIEVVIEEECTGNGTLACIDAGYDADAVLIPEPFGPTICTNQVGVFWFKIAINGVATHASASTSGVNAIEKAYPIIQALRRLEAKINRDCHPAYKGMKLPINLNIGIIKGGNWPSSVPSMAEIHGRFGYFPGKTFVEAQQSLIDSVRKSASEDDWLAQNQPRVEFYGLRHNGFSIERNVPAFRILNDCHKMITGEEAIDHISTAGSDLCVIHTFTKAEATTFGPVAENIHGPNERVNLESVMQTAKVYALFLARWCGIVE